MRHFFTLMVLIAIAGLLNTCSIDVAGGATSETTNGMTVSGVVVSEDGEPVDSADVFIRHKDFLKDTNAIFDKYQVPDAITDSAGEFVIDSVEPGDYYVEINYRGKTAKLAECYKESDTKPFVFKELLELEPVAGFYGIVDRDNIASSVNIYVQMYGLDRVQKVDSAGEFYFSGIPAGTHVIHMISSDPFYGIIDYDTITIDPAENRDVGTFLLPFDYYRDTLAVRAILDSNGMTDVSVVSVTNSKNGRIYELDLANKGITVLPSVVTELRLKLLRLQDNNLDSIPNAVGTIPTLTYLSLLRNNLTSIPESIGKLSHLKHLNLGYNRLTELPLSITKLTKLGYLSVAHNRLHGVSSPIRIWLDTFSTESNWEELQDP